MKYIIERPGHDPVHMMLADATDPHLEADKWGWPRGSYTVRQVSEFPPLPEASPVTQAVQVAAIPEDLKSIMLSMAESMAADRRRIDALEKTIVALKAEFSR